ncbi:hypothetical protein [Shewanella sp. 0m-4]
MEKSNLDITLLERLNLELLDTVPLDVVPLITDEYIIGNLHDLREAGILFTLLSGLDGNI